jgi:hypothetical protein
LAAQAIFRDVQEELGKSSSLAAGNQIEDETGLLTKLRHEN